LVHGDGGGREKVGDGMLFSHQFRFPYVEDAHNGLGGVHMERVRGDKDECYRDGVDGHGGRGSHEGEVA
jgi:hypothetical protein